MVQGRKFAISQTAFWGHLELRCSFVEPYFDLGHKGHEDLAVGGRDSDGISAVQGWPDTISVEAEDS